MKKIALFIGLILFFSAFAFAQSENIRIFTIFTSYGCGCVGSGGAPETFTERDEVMDMLQHATSRIDFIEWEGSRDAAVNELQSNKDSYDGVLIIGMLYSDFRLAFTGLPTIAVYNLFEFQNVPYNLLATGKMPERKVLEGGTNYETPKILTAQLDRRNLCAPDVRESMFNDLVYKINLIKTIKELKNLRILMLTADKNDIIAQVNYRGDFNESFPRDHNERYIRTLNELFGVEIVRVGGEEFYEAYRRTDIRKAEEVAEQWIRGASEVIASRSEIIKSARAYLATDALLQKYNCNAVSTHLRSVTGSGELKDRFNPGLGLELGFKPRGIMAVCQNYPDLLIGQVLAHSMTGRPSMMGDYIYDIYNNVQIVLHCGIPINPYGDERRLPYKIVPHAESPVRDLPEEPGSSTGLRVVWPAGEPVTLWEVHSLLGEIRMHTGEVAYGHSIYIGGENIDDVMCTAKLFAKLDDAKKIRNQDLPSKYGIHTNATLGDLRQQIKDIAILMGLELIETDR